MYLDLPRSGRDDDDGGGQVNSRPKNHRCFWGGHTPKMVVNSKGNWDPSYFFAGNLG